MDSRLWGQIICLVEEAREGGGGAKATSRISAHPVVMQYTRPKHNTIVREGSGRPDTSAALPHTA